MGVHGGVVYGTWGCSWPPPAERSAATLFPGNNRMVPHRTASGVAKAVAACTLINLAHLLAVAVAAGLRAAVAAEAFLLVVVPGVG